MGNNPSGKINIPTCTNRFPELEMTIPVPELEIKGGIICHSGESIVWTSTNKLPQTSLEIKEGTVYCHNTECQFYRPLKER